MIIMQGVIRIYVPTPRVSQPAPLKKNLDPRFGQTTKCGKCGTFGRIEKTKEVLIEVAFSFPYGFFFSVMAPLNFIHFNYFSSSTSLLLIKDFERIFNIREVWFHQDFLLFNNFGRNSDTLLKLRNMKDIVYG